MTRQEIINRIEKIEDARFYHKMKDHWNWKDFEYDRKLANEEFELRKQLKEMGEE